MSTSIFTTFIPQSIGALIVSPFIFHLSGKMAFTGWGFLLFFCHISAILVALISFPLLPLMCRGVNIKP